MTEYERKIIAYRMAVSLAKSMLKQGIITAEDYAVIDTILAEKYGISSCSIYRGMDLIYDGFRGNMVTNPSQAS